MQRSGTVSALALNSELKQKLGMAPIGHNFENYQNKPLKAQASVLQIERADNEFADGSGSIERKNNQLPKLNRYNVRALDS